MDAMDEMSPIPVPLWKAVPDHVIETLVTPSNLTGAMLSLKEALDATELKGNLMGIYANKVDILLSKTMDVLNSDDVADIDERTRL